MQNTSLFNVETRHCSKQAPLAYQLSPQTFDHYIGQQHLIGPTMPLRRAIESDQLTSLILWGPPGCGKTSLARLIAQTTQSQFKLLNAVTANIKDIKQIISEATLSSQQGKRTLLFIDEIHRFTKTQQDALLPDVESGIITLIGATTENPHFHVIGGLLSRCQLFSLTPHTSEDLVHILEHALSTHPTSLTFPQDTKHLIATLANGDARKCLNILEQALASYSSKEVCCADDIHQLIKTPHFATNADDHYDVASAFIKSLRGSDPDASLYWMTRLLAQGEPPEFLVRRMIIFASEDIGNADPQALPLTTSLLHATRFVGLPEIEINLAHVVTYLATAPKSNAAYSAYKKAKHFCRTRPSLPVPLHLKDAHYSLANTLNHGKEYRYPHDYPYSIVSQSYWDSEEKFYEPKPIGFEKTLRERLEFIRKTQDKDTHS